MTRSASPQGRGRVTPPIPPMDWAKTPLGPIDEWPASLRIAVDLTLSSPVAAILLWGTSLTQIYNEHWRDLVGSERLAAFGQPTHECPLELKTVMAPAYERALRGESTILHDVLLPVSRSDQIKHTWWNVYCNPVRHECGHVAGILCTVIESTRRVVAEKERSAAIHALRANEERQGFLLMLSDALRPLTDAVQIQQVTVKLVAEHFDLMRATYVEFDANHENFTLTERYERDGSSLPDTLRVSDFSPELRKVLHDGHTLVLRDTEAESRNDAERAAFRSMGVRASVAIPLVKEQRLIAAMAFHSATARNWTKEEVQTFEAVAERTWSAVVRARAEEAVRGSERRLRQFGAASSDGIWIRDTETLALIYANPAMEHIYGVSLQALRDEVGLWERLIVPEDHDHALACLEQVRRGKATLHEFRILRPTDQSIRWIRSTGFALSSDGSRPREIAGISSDITTVKLAAEQQQVLLGELQHRTRNLMGVVRSMADKTIRTSSDLQDFRTRFGDRMAALARVQGLLSRVTDVNRVTFDELIRTEMKAMGGDGLERISLSGPTGVRLRSSMVQTLAMVIHELATNAVKYGALGQPQARLAVSWALTPVNAGEKPRLHIEWRESGVTMPAKPADGSRKGQGRTLIEEALPYQFNAEVSYVLGPDGLHCGLSIPISNKQAPR